MVTKTVMVARLLVTMAGIPQLNMPLCYLSPLPMWVCMSIRLPMFSSYTTILTYIWSRIMDKAVVSGYLVNHCFAAADTTSGCCHWEWWWHIRRVASTVFFANMTILPGNIERDTKSSGLWYWRILSDVYLQWWYDDGNVLMMWVAVSETWLCCDTLASWTQNFKTRWRWLTNRWTLHCQRLAAISTTRTTRGYRLHIDYLAKLRLVICLQNNLI